jgi:ketosteroid isomerase-like protein
MTIDQLIAKHLDLIATDMNRWLDLLADDAVVELPYAGDLGVLPRLEGRDAIREHFLGVIKSFEGLTFSHIRTYPTTDPNVGVVEAHGSATITTTGRRYEQDYIMVVKGRDGRIVHYREYWNPLPVLAAFGKEVP